MFRKLIYSLLLLATAILHAQDNIPLIPKPQSLHFTNSAPFLLTNRTTLLGNKQPEAIILNAEIKRFLGFELPSRASEGNNTIELRINPLLKMDDEGYQININHKKILIVAHRLTTLKNCDKIIELKDGNMIIHENYEMFISNSN